MKWLHSFSVKKVPGPNLDSWLIPPPPQLRANRGPPLLQGEDEACFWLVKPGGGRGSCMPLRLVFQNLFCPMGSGGQLGLYSEYFPEEETERVEGKKKEEKKSDKQTREFGFKRHKKKKNTAKYKGMVTEQVSI